MKNSKGFFGALIAMLLILTVTLIGCQTGTIDKSDFLTNVDVTHVMDAPAMDIVTVSDRTEMSEATNSITNVSDENAYEITNTSKAEGNESSTVLTTKVKEGGSVSSGTSSRQLANPNNYLKTITESSDAKDPIVHIDPGNSVNR